MNVREVDTAKIFLQETLETVMSADFVTATACGVSTNVRRQSSSCV